jgi:hypothetical protein
MGEAGDICSTPTSSTGRGGEPPRPRVRAAGASHSLERDGLVVAATLSACRIKGRLRAA